MSSIKNRFLRVYKKLVSSIAFIPTIMVLLSFVIAILIIYFEDLQYYNFIRKNLQFVLVHGEENARMVLATIIGGIISLMVFSFSMVMVVLNRTSASLSPRVLPQLLAQKFHQIVLGSYMGTIVYSLILIINLNPDKNVPTLGILLSMIFTIISLGLFIYFIHSISLSIQVDNILREIYKRTSEEIEQIIKSSPDEKDFHRENISGDAADHIYAEKSGYYLSLNPNGLANKLQKNDLYLEVMIFEGQFTESGELLGRIYGKKPDEETKKPLINSFYLTTDADDREGYHSGLRKICEIAVKALSPGINDPGTALRAIRFHSMLFERILEMKSHACHMDNEDKIRVYRKLPDLQSLLDEDISPIRQYAGQSLEIYLALINLYKVLLKKKIPQHEKVLTANLRSTINAAEENISNPYDKKKIEEAVKDLFVSE